MQQLRPTFVAWSAGLLAAALPVWAALTLGGVEPGDRAAILVVCALSWAFGALPLLLRTSPSAAACAFAAGAGVGALVGVLAAEPTPTAWFMSDVAWHLAKVVRVAQGHPLEDPILRVPTIYPFAFHALLAVPVALGASAVAVLQAASVLVLPFLLGSFHALARALVEPRRAAWAALALPLFFYSSTVGHAFLPTPFNASLGCAFLGALGLVASTRSGSRAAAAWGGLALGLATLCWYGHAPWIGLSVLLWGRTRRKQLAAVLLGAAPCALVLLIHLASLRGTGDGQATAIVGAEASASLAERWAGMGRNLLTISGGFELRGSAFWVGPLLAAMLLVAVLRGRGPARAEEAFLRWALASLLPCLLAAGLWMTFWQPFSARYGFLLASMLLLLVAPTREWSLAARPLGLLALAALAAPWSAGRAALLHLARSQDFERQYRDGGAEVARFLEQHTQPDEPVFATTETWDRSIGCCVPRPNLVARRGGIYNFAPAQVVAPRWKTYLEVLEQDDPRVVRELLRPYGFRLVVVARDELSRPGLAAVARGFETVLENGSYLIFDLERPR